MQNHRRLEVYQLARGLAVDVYAVAGTLPPSERFDLARQLRRAVVSIGSNIAEGCGRSTRRDFRHFLGTALGSATELEFQLDLCLKLTMADPELVGPAIEKTKRVQQMLTRLITRIA